MTVPELPPELRAPTPRPLPRWARRTHISEGIIAVAVTATAALMVVAREWLLAGAILAVAAIVGAIALAIRTARVKLLREGIAAVGVVESVDAEARAPGFRFRYDTPSGPVSAVAAVERRLVADMTWPQPGDAVFLVYDPKGVTRSALWSLARGAAHDDTAARSFVARRRARGALLVGAFLVVTCGLPTIAWWLRQVPPGRVASCDASYSHHRWFHLALEDGRRHTVTSNEVADLEACPPPGTSIEKRRRELGYRLDGALRPVNGAQALFPGLLGVAGLGALAFGAARLARVRRRA